MALTQARPSSQNADVALQLGDKRVKYVWVIHHGTLPPRSRPIKQNRRDSEDTRRFCLISCINRPGSSARKTNKRFKRCRRMRRTARDVERRCRREAPLSVQPSRYCARARRYEKFRLRDGRIRLIESRLHILADRPCQIDRIGMTGRGDERNAEARHIPRGRSQYISVKLARGASARRNFAKSERPFERERFRIRLHRAPLGRT